MKKLSQKLKLFIAISIIWITFAYIFIILDVRYPDSEEYLEFLLFTAPVWISWLGFWIWGDSFIEFLNGLRNRIGLLPKITSNNRTKEFTQNNIVQNPQKNLINQISKSTEKKEVEIAASAEADSNENGDSYNPMKWLKFLAVLYLVNILLSILNPSTYAEILSGIDGYFYSLGTYIGLCILPFFFAFLRILLFSKPRNREFLTSTNYVYLFLSLLSGVVFYTQMMTELKIGVFYYFDGEQIFGFLAAHVIIGIVILGFPIYYIIDENKRFKKRIDRSGDLK